MNKLLIVVLPVAAAGLTWLMLPKSAPGPIGGAGAMGSGEKTDKAAPAKVIRPQRPAPMTAPPPAARPLPVVVQPTGEAPESAPRVAVGTVVDGKRYGRRPEDGPATVGTAELKDSVRRYWNALPKSGAMSKSVPAEDLLPPALLAQMNVPAGSQITMIGDFQVDRPDSFTAFLATQDTLMTMKGFTFITPDGVEVRDYVRMKPLPK